MLTFSLIGSWFWLIFWEYQRRKDKDDIVVSLSDKRNSTVIFSKSEYLIEMGKLFIYQVFNKDPTKSIESNNFGKNEVCGLEKGQSYEAIQ